MKIIVQKYGGSSVSDIEKIKYVAKKIISKKKEGYGVVVVVSAMGKTTDSLLSLAKEINPQPSRRELDMLLSVGERISMALLTMAIQFFGEDAISLTGSQSGIITNASHSNARIIEVRPFRIQDEIEKGKIVIVAGYQGMSYNREITTLGRGGSDTTAVALTGALGAEYCEIFSDVDGVYTADPKIVQKAKHLEEITYDEMLFLSYSGAKVLCAEAVEFAKKNNIILYCKATFDENGKQTIIRKDIIKPPLPITGITYKKGAAFLALPEKNSPDKLFETLNIEPFFYIFENNAPSSFKCILFPENSFSHLIERKELKGGKILFPLGVITIVGSYIHTFEGFKSLNEVVKDQKIFLIIQNQIGVSLLVEENMVEESVKKIHKKFFEE